MLTQQHLVSRQYQLCLNISMAAVAAAMTQSCHGFGAHHDDVVLLRHQYSGCHNGIDTVVRPLPSCRALPADICSGCTFPERG